MRAATWSAILALVACLEVTPALCAAVFDSTLIAGPFDTRTRPRIALAPDGRAELLYACTYAGLMTAWRCSMGEPRSYELIASDLALSTYPQPLWALAASGAPRAAYFKPNGRFVCALREPEGWVGDSSLVDVVFSAGCQQSLAVDPVSGEPRVAFTVAQDGYWRLKYAWRQSGTWSVADVDPDPVLYAPLCLALDAAGRPYVAYVSVSGETLYVASRSAPGETFSREVVTSTSDLSAEYFSVSVAADPAGGQPRVAWFFWGQELQVGYAFRDEASGTWTSQVVDSGLVFPPHPVSLALDAAGDPAIAYTHDVNILASTPPRRLMACDSPLEGGTTGQVWRARRAGGAGTGPFSLEAVPLHDVIVESGGLAVTPAGYAHLALRGPELSAGSPLHHYSVIYSHYEPDLTGVPAASAHGFSLAPPSPNPARAGGPLRIAFTIPHAGAVTCDLLDPSGRGVAARPPQDCPAGPSAFNWTPGPLPPGLYFLRLRAGPGAGAVRRLVMLR